MKWLLCLCGIVSIVSAGYVRRGLAQDNKNNNGDCVEVFSFPFDAETLCPVTPTWIRARGAHCKLCAQRARSLVQVLDVAAPSRPTEVFSENRVRVLIRSLDADGAHDLAIIDKEGRVIYKGERKALRPNSLASLRRQIREGCNTGHGFN